MLPSLLRCGFLFGLTVALALAQAGAGDVRISGRVLDPQERPVAFKRND
jgi:hypothetical protein